MSEHVHTVTEPVVGPCSRARGRGFDFVKDREARRWESLLGPITNPDSVVCGEAKEDFRCMRTPGHAKGDHRPAMTEGQVKLLARSGKLQAYKKFVVAHITTLVGPDEFRRPA